MQPTLRLIAALSLTASLPLGATDWLTFGGNAQRTGFSTDENEITKSSVKNMKLAWKVKLDTLPKELNSLTTPIVLEKAVTPKGFKELIIVAGADNTVFAIDGDNGSIFWKTKLAVEGTPKGYLNWLCHQGLNATPTIHKPTRSVLVVAADGKLHDINYVSGDEQKPAKQFVPPYSKPYSLVVNDGVLYAATGQGCGQNRNGVYAMDLQNPERPVTSFQVSTAGAGIWGRAGLAITASGMLVGETGDGPYDPEGGKWADTFLGLKEKTLTLADYYTPQNRAWITKKDLDMGCMSPVVFTYKGRELVAGGGKEGVLYLLDATKMGGEDHRTPLFRSPLWTNQEVDFAGRGFWGASSTYEDKQGTRWLYVPAWGPPTAEATFEKSYGATPDGSVMAFRVEGPAEAPVLKPVWNSLNMAVPEPVVINNDIVFGLSSGEYVRQVDNSGALLTSELRIKNKKGNAVLHAFDAQTGQPLWNSGDTMKDFVHFSGLAINTGRVFAVTFDGTLYAFALPQ